MKRPTSTRFCTASLLALLVGQAAVLSMNINRPWTGHHDWNGACWAQAARWNLRVGLGTTWGVPASRYFGPPPVPPEGYYVHHPPGMSLGLTALFAVFGEHEWAARLLPIVCSLLSTVLLWFLVRNGAGERAATLSALVFVLLPMELYFGRMVDHVSVALMWMLAALLGLQRWLLTDKRGYGTAAWACLVAGMWTAWPVYLLALVAAAHFFWKRDTKERAIAWALVATVAVSAALFLLHIRLVRADAWQDFFAGFALRAGSHQGASRFTWAEWFVKQSHSLTAGIPLVAWVLATGGAVVLWRRMSFVGWAGLWMAATAALFLVMFRDGSWVHDYWGFYFVAPVAMFGGLTLDTLARWRVGRLVAVLSVLVLGVRGVEQTRAFHRFQYHILDWVTPEPADLIPALGYRIAGVFPSDSTVFCNFLPYTIPQLDYYAQRVLIPGDRPRGTKAGAVIWLGAPGAEQSVASLPAGLATIEQFGALRFLFWRPDYAGTSH